ncbi:MAG: hypothetical protein WC490_07695 [Candidatus Margulisiibacteriota bacterium]
MKLPKVALFVVFAAAAAAAVFTAGNGTRIAGSGLDAKVLEFALKHPGQDSLVVSSQGISSFITEAEFRSGELITRALI